MPETPPPLACVEYTKPLSTDVRNQMRWLCGKETDVHVYLGIDQGRPSILDVLKSLCQYHLT